MFDIGDFRIDPAKRLVVDREGRAVSVPSRAFDVLVFLVQRPGDLVDKSSIMSAVWPDTVVEESNLTQSIFTLRKILGERAGSHRYIATVPGRGYQFVAAVRITHRDADVPHAPAAESLRTIEPPHGLEYEKARRRKISIAVALSALGMAALLAFGLLFRQSHVSPVKASPLAAAPITIAVLPFADLSPTHDMEYFGDGITEEIMSNLTRVDGLRLTARRSSSVFKGSKDDAQTIGEKLRVAMLLEGSVRKEGDRIRISAQITRTQDGISVWAQTYTRSLDQVFDVQGSIARDVVAALGSVVKRIEPGARAPGFDAALTGNPEAYRAFLRGTYLFTRSVDRDPKTAREEFEHAIALDPKFAKAHAMLARTYDRSADLGMGDAARNRARASAELDLAMKLDPSIGDLWWVRLFFVAGDGAPIAAQARDLEGAVAANPDDVEPMIWLGHLYLSLGRRPDAIRMFERAREVDPLSPMALRKVAWASYTFGGDRQRMLSLADELDRLAPADAFADGLRAGVAWDEGRPLDWDRFNVGALKANPRDYRTHCSLATSYADLGMPEPALYHANICERIDSRDGLGTAAAAHAHAVSGDVPGARALLEARLARQPGEPAVLVALGELQYLDGNCPLALRSIDQGRPIYRQPAASLDLIHNADGFVIYAWCLRQQSQADRVADFRRAFDSQFAPSSAPGVFAGIRVRMAAALGDREALVRNLDALLASGAPAFAFAAGEPMLRPWLADAEVMQRLARLDSRRADWRRELVAKSSSTRIPIPGIDRRDAL